MSAKRLPVYLDYNGTTPVDKEVCEVMATMMYTNWGNPSSSHYYGVQAKVAVETARRQTADLIGAQPGEITFMSNGTETINATLKGLAELSIKEGRDHLITQATEHVAVLETCKSLERQGCKVTYLPVDGEGLVSAKDVEAAITPRTFCISIMHSNNETGTLQPIREIVACARAASNRIFVHCDTSQSLGKMAFSVADLEVDFATIAGHKIYAPKGVGALYQRLTTPRLPPLLHGAGQEGGRRASTENAMHIVGLGKACEVALRDLVENERHQRQMRDRLHEQLKERLGPRAKYMRVNGPLELRLPNTLNVSFFQVEANTLLSEIGDDVAASAGAACHSDEVHVSHVLEAMGVAQDWAMGTCRFTVGRATTEQEVDRAAQVIAAAAARFMPGDEGFAPPERPTGSDVKLTRFTHGMGCACKLRPQLLEQVLAKVRQAAPQNLGANVLAGLGKNNEDACVYKLTEELAVVGTLDFFTPIVDEPEVFGGVAAANALSDVYAMGARPIFALNIVGFPSNRLSPEVLADILRGGQAKCTEAGVPILGGHTVEDLEPKYGLCVIGIVHPKEIWLNNAMQDGDSLVLTKGLGTGVLGTAMKRGVLGSEEQAAFVASILQLNKTAAEYAKKGSAVRAATDVTGFGLLGHLVEMLTPADGAAPLAAAIEASAVPLLPGARRLAQDDQCVPGGSVNNLKGAEEAGVDFAADVPPELRLLLADAQSSGGLLLSVAAPAAAGLVEELRSAGLEASAVIGRVRARDAGPIIRVTA